MSENASTQLRSITVNLGYSPPAVEPEALESHGVLEKCLCGCGSQSGAGSGAGMPTKAAEVERD